MSPFHNTATLTYCMPGAVCLEGVFAIARLSIYDRVSLSPHRLFRRISDAETPEAGFRCRVAAGLTTCTRSLLCAQAPYMVYIEVLHYDDPSMSALPCKMLDNTLRFTRSEEDIARLVSHSPHANPPACAGVADFDDADCWSQEEDEIMMVGGFWDWRVEVCLRDAIGCLEIVGVFWKEGERRLMFKGCCLEMVGGLRKEGEHKFVPERCCWLFGNGCRYFLQGR